MLVSYHWLKDYVDIPLTAQEFAARITAAGLEAEGVDEARQGIKGVVAGRIKTIVSHAQSDKLLVCKVDAGRELQVVTGAKNLKPGQTVPVVLDGGFLPGLGEVQETVFRGVASEGMLLSAFELGLDDAAEAKAGILILSGDIAPGTDLVAYAKLDDIVVDLSLTPNRSDCLSLFNLARETAAILQTPLHLPRISYAETLGPVADFAAVKVLDEELCPRYTARVVKNIKVGPSPLWMQQYLRSAGIRPINNVVDIGNFVMLETGQPLHVFDYDLLAKGEIIVRRAKEGELIVTLDGQKRVCHGEQLLICDAEKPVCIAGVMGALNSEITGGTQNVLIEAAVFDPVSIRRTSRELGLRSESSLRYEKGLDSETTPFASSRCAELLVKLCGGEAATGILDTYQGQYQKKEILLRPARVNRILGTELSRGEIASVMQRLAFGLKERGGELLVTVPSYRLDIQAEIDLVEEVSRLDGYDKIPVTLPEGTTTQGKLTPWQIFLDRLQEACAALGLRQVITYDFIGAKDLDALLLPQASPLRRAVAIANPLNEERSLMRSTLLPGLLAAAAKNYYRRQLELGIFECGAIFIPSGEILPQEPLTLGMLSYGKTEAGWLDQPFAKDFFYLKGIWESLCQSLKLKDWQMAATEEHAFLHPGKAAEIRVGGQSVGFIGELHPAAAASYDLPAVAVCQVDVAGLYAAYRGDIACRPLPKYPAVSRDMALVVPRHLTAGSVEALIRLRGGDFLNKVALFDVYEGSQLPADCCGLAYKLSFQAENRTLTDEEVAGVLKNILEALMQEYGVKLRY